MNEQVILVDNEDNVLGTMEKMDAHVLGKLHRAFSVFIFNKDGELLLQQRALEKYHSGGKWTNTCCSHPRLGEDTLDAAHRRLWEEMGMKCHLQYAFNFTYKAELLDGIEEHEYDHVYFGVSDEFPVPDPEEVSAYKYLSLNLLAKDLKQNPDEYTEWLKICFKQVQERTKLLL
ncbi:MAG: isopentenyl-diphosphate Delta-isomerase [Pedobacter sp.]|nr:MAG: isopentenyl-diphosphate Delta-isomerase [Pedobacter sp.]